MTPGPQFNIKMPSYQYRKCHCGDKTILRPSYLHNGISYTGKMTSLYWIGALWLCRNALERRSIIRRLISTAVHMLSITVAPATKSRSCRHNRNWGSLSSKRGRSSWRTHSLSWWWYDTKASNSYSKRSNDRLNAKAENKERPIYVARDWIPYHAYLIHYIRIVSWIKWSPAQFEVQHNLDISTVFICNHNSSQQQ